MKYHTYADGTYMYRSITITLYGFTGTVYKCYNKT